MSIVEIEFSLLRRRTEALVAECLKLNITVLAWAPLGSGRLVHPDTVGDARTRAVAGMLDVISRRRGRTPAQVALNWVICKGAVPIPGARTKAQAVENCGAAGWRLRPEDVQALDAVAVLDGGYYNDPEAVLTFCACEYACRRSSEASSTRSCGFVSGSGRTFCRCSGMTP